MTSLWQAIAIIMAVSVLSLGFRAGAIVALSIPLTLAIVFLVMQFVSIDLQRISLGALIIALTLLVDDAMSTVDAMTARLAEGDPKEEAATFAYKTLAFPMLTGIVRDHRRLRADRVRGERGGRVHVLDLRGRQHRFVASWFVAVLFIPLLGVTLLAPPKTAQRSAPGMAMRIFRRVLVAAMRMRWMTILVALACFVVALLAFPHVPRQFFPSSDRPELLVDLRLPQNASIFASERSVGQARCRAQGRPRCRALEYLCRARRDPVLPSAQCRSFRTISSARSWWSQRTSPRASACGRSSSSVLQDDFPERREPHRSAGARAAGRMAGAIPRQRA